MTGTGVRGLSAVVASSDGSIDAFVWVTRLFLVLVGLGIVAVLVVALRIFVWNPVREALRARAAGSWWLPFEPLADGSYGPLCDLRRIGTFRAPPPGRRTGRALAFRWGFWGALAGVTAVAVVRIGVLLVAGVPRIWV